MSTQSPPGGCRLLKLPIELRLMIYDELFRSTRLRWGTRQNQHNVGRSIDIQGSQIQTGSFSNSQSGDSSWLNFRSYRWQPAANSLAILRTCEQIYDEARNRWLGRVLFFFDDADAMHRRLNMRPKQARHIKHLLLVTSQGVVGRDFKMLENIHGLELDTFILYGAHSKHDFNMSQGQNQPRFRASVNMSMLGRNLATAPPWKNFYFFVPDNCFLPSSLINIQQRTLRPSGATWQETREYDHELTDSLKESLKWQVMHLSPDKREWCNPEIFTNLYRRPRRKFADRNEPWRSADLLEANLVILSCHYDSKDAEAERQREIDGPWAPSVLPFVHKPQRRTMQELTKPLMRDSYRSVLDYDWSAEWGDPAANVTEAELECGCD